MDQDRQPPTLNQFFLCILKRIFLVFSIILKGLLNLTAVLCCKVEHLSIAESSEMERERVRAPGGCSRKVEVKLDLRQECGVSV